MSVIWGIPYLFIKIAVAEMSPVAVAFTRIAVASLVLLPVALSRGSLGGLRQKLGWLVALAFLEVVVPFPLIAAGEQRIASSLTGLLISSEPLVVALLAIRFDRSERVGGTRLAGLVIGLVGVVTLLGVDVGAAQSELLGAGMVLAATVSYAGGAMLVKRKLAGVNSLGVSTVAVALSAALLAPAAWPTLPHELPSAGVLASLLILGVICTAAGFILFFSLVAAAGPSRATVITYVNPAVAVALGVAVLGEPVTGATVAGFLLIIAGCWLSTGGTPPSRRRGAQRLARWAARGPVVRIVPPPFTSRGR